MAGIYIHVPFCRQACHYCSFHFSTSLRLKEEMMSAMLIEMQQVENKPSMIDTIYFGGGTPSILSIEEIKLLMDQIYRHYEVSGDVEVTLEANPEDLSEDYVKGLRDLGVNRLSIGIQSFLEDDLQYMNRAHSAEQSLQAIEYALSGGIRDVSLDLMFGLIGSDQSAWRASLEQIIDLSPTHISCYNLTVEEQTAFAHWREKGQLQEVDENIQYEQYLMTHELLSSAGYDHYEISNYAKPGHRSRHNQSYWNSQPYIGIGPSAHSFNGERRSWNVANNAKYLKQIKEGQERESELLSPSDRYNEYIMLGLRTAKGIAKSQIDEFPKKMRESFDAVSARLLGQGVLKSSGDTIYLSPEQWYISDAISAELFWDAD